MRILLDTHAVLWMLADSPLLSRRAAALLADAGNHRLVSAVSAYEICWKVTLGKLPQASSLASDFEAEIAPLDLGWLPIAPAHAIAAGKLDPSHRDPFDRLLIAQALVEDVPIVSNDAVFDQLKWSGFGDGPQNG